MRLAASRLQQLTSTNTIIRASFNPLQIPIISYPFYRISNFSHVRMSLHIAIQYLMSSLTLFLEENGKIAKKRKRRRTPNNFPF